MAQFLLGVTRFLAISIFFVLIGVLYRLVFVTAEGLRYGSVEPSRSSGDGRLYEARESLMLVSPEPVSAESEDGFDADR